MDPKKRERKREWGNWGLIDGAQASPVFCFFMSLFCLRPSYMRWAAGDRLSVPPSIFDRATQRRGVSGLDMCMICTDKQPTTPYRVQTPKELPSRDELYCTNELKMKCIVHTDAVAVNPPPSSGHVGVGPFPNYTGQQPSSFLARKKNCSWTRECGGYWNTMSLWGRKQCYFVHSTCCTTQDLRFICLCRRHSPFLYTTRREHRVRV